MHVVLPKPGQVFSLGGRSLGGLKRGREGGGPRRVIERRAVQIISPFPSLVFLRCFSCLAEAITH